MTLHFFLYLSLLTFVFCVIDEGFEDDGWTRWEGMTRNKRALSMMEGEAHANKGDFHSSSNAFFYGSDNDITQDEA